MSYPPSNSLPERLIREVLKPVPKTVQEICAETGHNQSVILIALRELEQREMAFSSPFGWRSRF